MKTYIKVIGVSIISVLIIYQSISLYQLKRDLETTRRESYQLREDVLSLINGIDSGIQSTIYEEIGRSHLTKDVKFTYNKNIEVGHNVSVRVELEQANNESSVIFMFKNGSSSNWETIELMKINELSYQGNIDLPYGEQYEYKVVLKDNNSQSSEIGYIDKSEFIPTIPDVGYGYSDDEISLSVYSNYYYENNQVDIGDVQVIVGYNGKEKSYNCKASNERLEENNSASEMRYYEVSIPRKDYNNKFDYIKLKVTYKNGIIDIVDVTDQLRELNN